MPPGDSNSDVDFTGIKTIPQLAVATRLQEYKDLIGASGSRYSDWLYTFFASKIDHVDRPKLLFSSSVMVNSQVVMNQAGQSGFAGGEAAALGQMGGSIAFNTVLGREQTYYFKEPGYIFDMLTIRPVYFGQAYVPIIWNIVVRIILIRFIMILVIKMFLFGVLVMVGLQVLQLRVWQ